MIAHRASSPVVRWALRIGCWILFLAVAYLLLRPVLRTPVSDDDFEGPFAAFQNVHYGFSQAVSLGWHQSFVSGDRTRIFGVLGGDVFSWFLLWASHLLSISITRVYEAVKFCVFVACALSGATFWWATAKAARYPVRWDVAAVLVSLLLFGSLQLHPWTADPVQSYPLAGFLSVAIGFWVLTCAVWIARRPTPLRVTVATIVAVLSISWYEFDLGAVLGGLLILGAAAWGARRRPRRLLGTVLGAAVFVGVPLVWLAVSRLTARGDTYTGRQLSSNGAGHSFIISVISSLPGAAWHLSAANVGAWPSVTALAVVVGIIGVLVLGVAVGYGVRAISVAATKSRPGAGAPDLVARERPAPAVDADGNLSRGLLAAGLLGAVLFALFAIALEGATTRLDHPEIGYVYTAYSAGAAVVALLAGALIWWVAGGSARTRRAATVVLVLVVGCFLVEQYAVNTRMNTLTNIQFAMNTGFDDAFTADVPEPERCQALVTWLNYPWPAYYRQGVMTGSYYAYKHFYGQPMCSSWVDPSTNFSPEGAVGVASWWMVGPIGEIDFEAPDCQNGCRGRIEFTAAGFGGRGHRLTVSSGPGEVRSVDVPGRGSVRVSVPVTLTNPFGSLTVQADGRGVTPKSLGIDDDSRTLFIGLQSPRFVPAG